MKRGVCLICGKLRSSIDSHLSIHGITTKEYRERFDLVIPVMDWDNVGLGTAPDPVIARKINISRQRVGEERRKRNIPAFGGLVLTQEGFPCRSIYEAKYDAYLHWKNVSHQHEVTIPPLSFRHDFMVEGRIVEIKGMLNFAKYEERNEHKQRICEAAGLDILWLTQEDVNELYTACPVDLIFRDRFCSDCGVKTNTITIGKCKKCYMLYWKSSKKHKGE